MTISVSFARPAATLTNTEDQTVTWNLTEDDTNNQVILDRVVTISATARLVRRLKIAEVISGSNLSLQVTDIQFAGNVSAYVSSTNPADSAGTATTTSLGSQDLDAFHTAAGDARS